MFSPRTCGEANHKYEARYEEKSNGIIVSKAQGVSGEELNKVMKDKLYIKDICVKCGKEIKR